MTESIQQMLSTHPLSSQSALDIRALTECIDACFGCEQVCTSCADACLGEQEHLAHLIHCIRLNLDCADICGTTGRVLMRQTQPDLGVLRAQVHTCMVACKACGDECQGHAEQMGMKHCEICMQACRRCESTCQALLHAFPA